MIYPNSKQIHETYQTTINVSGGGVSGILKDGCIESIIEFIKNEDYPGIRMFCVAFLGTAKTRFHFDIGFGDEIIPSPALMDFPVLLENSPIPEIVAYSPESAIAEKFQAMFL